MTDLNYRPRPAWTDPETHTRKLYPFMRQAGDGSYRRTPMPLHATEDLLLREGRELGAQVIVIEVVAPERAFRLDGLMRADAKIDHPGVVVSMNTKHGPLRYATDTFARWQDNLRAIALALEALRKVDRYGVTKRGEQYTGWKALPPGGPIALSEGMDVDEAVRILAEGAQLLAQDEVALIRWSTVARLSAYRAAAKKHHPDVGGQRHTWDRIELAKRTLDQSGGVT